MVPSSLETCFRATVGTVSRHCSFSFSRRGLERLLISSKEVTPRWSHVKICFPRKAGSPIAFISAVSSSGVRDFKSIILPRYVRFMRQM